MSDTADQGPENITTARSTSSSRFGGVCLLAALALLPSMVTVTGISDRGLKWIHPELAKVTQFEHLTLHWWSPIECRGLKISNTREWSRDAPPLLTAERITTQQPLWQVAWNLGRGIDVAITGPQLNLINSNRGSNLTEACEDLGAKRNSRSPAFPFRVVIQDGRINLAIADPDSATSESHNLFLIESLVSGIQADISRLDTSIFLPDVSLVASLANNPDETVTASRTAPTRETTVPLRVAARLDRLAADFRPPELAPANQDDALSDLPMVRIKMGPVGDNTLRAMRISAHGLQLDVLQPLIAQLFPGVRCGGMISVQGEVMMLGSLPADGFTVRAAARAADVNWHHASWHPDETLKISAVSADLAVAVAEDGIIVQSLSFDCPFASLNGEGEIRLPAERPPKSILKSDSNTDIDRTSVVAEAEAAAAGQVNIRGRADLVALSRMLPRTFHLRDGIQLTQGMVTFAARTQPETYSDTGLQRLDWQAVAETSRIVARLDQKTLVWDSPVRLQCSGLLSISRVKLRTAKISSDFGQIEVSPTENALKIYGRINVERLWSHLAKFVDSAPSAIRGEVVVHADVERSSSDDVVLRDVQVLADNLRIESERLAVRMNQPLPKMLDGQLTLTGSGAAVRSFFVPWTGLSWLAPESQVFVQLDAVASHRLTIVGEIQPGSKASVSPGPSKHPTSLQIKQAQLALDIDTDTQPDHYVIRSGHLWIPGVEMQLSGTLETTGEWMTTQLVIAADYDLTVLSRMALSDLDQDIRLTGRRHTQITVQGTPAFWDGTGPSHTAPLHVTGEFGWESVDICGLRLGPGIVPFRLKAGQLQTDPIRCSINGGQLSAMLNYDLQQNFIAMASGSRVENITVTEELSDRWLSYVTPLLAEAAGVRGSVSARLNRFYYNLDRPESSEFSGTVDIQGITATPGSSLSVLVQALDTFRSGRRSLVRDLSFPPQQIQCELRNGFVTHDRILLTLSGYNLRSQGSVGLNKQLNLTLEVPLEKSNGQRSRGSVSVPVTGSVSRPRIDLGQILQDVGTRRLQGEINNQLERGLNGLFNKLR